MTIISSAQLTAELPSGADSTKATNAVNRASDLVNSWATHYEQFPDYNQTQGPPYQIQLITIEVAKALYWMGMGQQYRDGGEQEAWSKVLDSYEKQLSSINVPPSGFSQTISLDTYGVMLVGIRGSHILPWHPKLCYVLSAATPTTTVWNQGYHWHIRRGDDTDREFYDGWYFDATTYMNSIEGTLYYARSWRNDGYDYAAFAKVPRSLSMDGNPVLR